MAAITLKFPAQNVIDEYLKKHPFSALYQGQGILEKIAHVFANQVKTPNEVDSFALKTLFGLKLGLQPIDLITIQINLSAALKDCARGKPFTASKL